MKLSYFEKDSIKNYENSIRFIFIQIIKCYMYYY